MRRIRLSFAMVATASLALGACQLFFDLSDLPPVAEDEAGVDSGPRPSDAGITAEACTARPPSPPVADLSVSGENLGFAIRSVAFGSVAGYDLDGLDTVADGGPTGLPCKGAPLDLACGVDKAFNAALEILPGGAASADFRVNSLMEAGTQGVLFRLYKAGPTLPANVNGVQLAVATSALSTVGSNYMLADGGTAPRWDGLDTWVHEDFAGRTSDTAYVKDGVLVARYKSLSLTFAELTLTVSAAVITARVVVVNTGADGGLLTLQQGVIAGRVNAEAAINAAARFPIKGTPLCQAPGALPMLKDAVCAQRDLPGVATSYSPTATCDSLSIAIGFEAVAAGSNGTVANDSDADACQGLVDAACP